MSRASVLLPFNFRKLPFIQLVIVLDADYKRERKHGIEGLCGDVDLCVINIAAEMDTMKMEHRANGKETHFVSIVNQSLYLLHT